ncbi:MAG: TerC family protein [Phycisphaerales bacterium]
MTILAESLLFPFAEYWGFYAGFLAFVVFLLSLDLGVFHRKAHAVSMKEAAAWSVVWIALALLFCGGLWWYAGYRLPDRMDAVVAAGYDSAQQAANSVALQYLTGYIVEKSLSVDNIFVFVVLFGFFAVPPKLQHRVLFYGIVGALIFRAIFIALGAALLQYAWVVWIFGAFLILTGIKIIFAPEKQKDPEKNVILRLLRRWMPLTSQYHEDKFFVREAGRWVGTPLFVALVMIEFSDVIFAVDSVPAIFAITKEPFIVFTSNIFAILGLRSLYFLLAGAADKFHMLKYGLGIVLIFVGAKMVTPSSVYPEAWDGHFPITWSLGIICAVIGGSMGLSLAFPAKHAPEGAAKH